MFNLYFHEWPLVLFTVLSQISAGLTFTFFIYKLKNYNNVTLDEYKKVFLILSITMGVSLIISCFHLSNVFAGFYTLTKIFDNYLVIEVYSLAAFTSISFLLFLLAKLNKIGVSFASLCINLLVILAIIGLISMSGIYGSMYRTVIAWNFTYVLLLFFTVSIMMGGLAFSFLPLSLLQHKFRISYLVSFVGFFLFVFIFPLYMVYLGKTTPINLRNIFEYSHLYSILLSIGLVFTIIGFAIMLFKGSLTTRNIKLIFILVLIGQLVIRSLFYSLITTHLM